MKTYKNKTKVGIKKGSTMCRYKNCRNARVAMGKYCNLRYAGRTTKPKTNILGKMFGGLRVKLW